MTPRSTDKPPAKRLRGKRGKSRARIKPFRGAALAQHTIEVVERLRREYPDAHCELDYRSPYELLVATILSAQTTDKRVNLVTPALFARFPSVDTLAVADPAVLEDIIRSTGFFRAKARSLIGMATAVMARFAGAIPATMAELVSLPGVGRKTSNVVLGNAFHRDEGIVVDTHVARLCARLGLTAETDPVKIEQALMRVVPRADWTLFSHLLIFHGRRVCAARAPAHDRCVLADICPSATAI
jgi:endonuclease III